jgi:low affinity Fe/Cu permease
VRAGRKAGPGLAASEQAVEQITSHIAKAANTAIASSWAIFVAASVALFLFFFGDLIGLDRQRVDLHFLVDAATFLMVFVIEHTQSREVAALHTKLDAVIRALDADTSTVGIEELSQKEIQEIRDRRRERTPGARAKS